MQNHRDKSEIPPLRERLPPALQTILDDFALTPLVLFVVATIAQTLLGMAIKQPEISPLIQSITGVVLVGYYGFALYWRFVKKEQKSIYPISKMLSSSAPNPPKRPHEDYIYLDLDRLLSLRSEITGKRGRLAAHRAAEKESAKMGVTAGGIVAQGNIETGVETEKGEEYAPGADDVFEELEDSLRKYPTITKSEELTKNSRERKWIEVDLSTIVNTPSRDVMIVTAFDKNQVVISDILRKNYLPNYSTYRDFSPSWRVEILGYSFINPTNNIQIIPIAVIFKKENQ